jgi:hypothetical protein
LTQSGHASVLHASKSARYDVFSGEGINDVTS